MRRRSPRDVIARYSLVKVAGCIVGVGTVSVWMLLDGAAQGWRPASGAHAGFYPLALAGAVLGLISCLALTATFILARGVAILRVGDDLTLNYPFRRRRLLLRNMIVEAVRYQVQDAQSMLGFRTPPIIADQLMFSYPGLPPLTFRTALLVESPALIVRRIEKVVADDLL